MPLFDIGLLQIFNLPKVSINLMLEKTQSNDPFYAAVVKKFYALANARHAKLFFAKQYEYGFALCRLPESFEDYFHALKKSARWNYRKATRLGYEVKRFDVNSRLEDIADIWRSTPVRQGKLPKVIREGRVVAVNDPPSRSPFHDYYYVGVFGHGKLLAYASCAIMGELCNLNDLYGHVEHEQDGLVPLLLIKIAEEIFTSYPSVKFYAYGTYFGARAPMRRFKRKFQFYPYRVSWVLETPPSPSPKPRMIWRRELFREMPQTRLTEGSLVVASRLSDLPRVFSLWRTLGPWWKTIRAALKLATGKRVFFGIESGNRLIQSGWAHLGFCRHYSVESDSVVLERVWTHPDHRAKGLASTAMIRVMNGLFRRGYRRFYVDTTPRNIAAQKMIAKAGFTQRMD